MEIGHHYRPVSGDHDPGIYRVVGTTDGVTLLRVADADARRVHTGETYHVEVSTLESEFEPAHDPDDSLSLATAVRNATQGVYWSVRRFLP